MKILWKIGGVLAFSAISLPVIGLLYQRMAERRDARKFPPPGKLVDIGGYRLHLYEMRANKPGPTVVLEAGLGSSCLDWCKVQPEVAKFARAVSYDRAGSGWSDAGPAPRTSKQIALELHTLLTRADIPGPYILVAHSFGGLNIRLFADMYPQEVAGMVFVDTSHEDQNAIPALSAASSKDERLIPLLSMTASFGLLRLLVATGQTPLKQMRYPADIVPQVKSLWSQTRTMHMNALELDSFEESAAQVRASRASRHSYGTLPLYVLSQSMKTSFKSPEEQQIQEGWQELQRDLASLSTHSTHIVTDDSSHYIQLDQPELVIAAIQTVAQAANEQARAQGQEYVQTPKNFQKGD